MATFLESKYSPRVKMQNMITKIYCIAIFNNHINNNNYDNNNNSNNINNMIIEDCNTIYFCYHILHFYSRGIF